MSDPADEMQTPVNRVRRRSGSGLRPAVVLFAAQCVLLSIVLAVGGKFRVELVPDSASYLNFPLRSPVEALKQNRTHGYPLFAQGISATLGLSSIPVVQFAAHLIAVAVFWWGYRQWSTRELPAFLAASSLLFANIELRYVGTVGPDALAAAAGVLTIGLLLALIKQPERWWLWAGVAAVVFAACQIRPAYLFLVLLPALVARYGGLLLKHSAGTGDRWLSLKLLAASATPLLLFCLCRWCLVGSFGLVSFGGYNFAGLVGQFLEPATVSALPADVVPLAEELLQRRSNFAAEHPEFSTDVTRSYSAIESRWDASTWEIAVPAARAVHGDDLLAINGGLSRLGLSIVAARPADYAVWLIKAFFRAVSLMASETLVNPVYLALLLALIGVQLVCAVRRFRPCDVPPYRGKGDISAGAILLFVTTAYACGSLLVVIVSSPPLGRFMDAAGIFWPAVLAVMLADRLEALRQTSAPPDEPSP